MNKLQELITTYAQERGQMSEKQKAEAEVRIWDMHLTSIPRGEEKPERRYWLSSTLNGTLAEFELRNSLINAGAWVEPLWKMSESGTPLYTIIRLFRKARFMAVSDKMPCEAALRVVLDYYNSGYDARSQNGKAVKRRHPTFKPRSKSSIPPSEHERINSDSSSSQNTRSKQFLSDIMSLVEVYSTASVSDLGSDDFVLLQMAKEDFMNHAREAVEDFRRRISASRASSRKNEKKQKITRDKFKRACEVLNLPYTYGRPVDLRICKRTMLKRAGPLHPDRNNGSHSARVEYQAIIESYVTLETYSEGLKNENGDRINEGQ